jgi:ribosomal protein L11 methylase PrmA
MIYNEGIKLNENGAGGYNMRWIEAVIGTRSEDIEKLCEDLTEAGVDAFVIEDEADFKKFLEENRQYWDYVDAGLEHRFEGVSRVRFYLPDNEESQSLISGIRKKLSVTPGISYIEDRTGKTTGANIITYRNRREAAHSARMGENGPHR